MLEMALKGVGGGVCALSRACSSTFARTLVSLTTTTTTISLPTFQPRSPSPRPPPRPCAVAPRRREPAPPPRPSSRASAPAGGAQPRAQKALAAGVQRCP